MPRGQLWTFAIPGRPGSGAWHPPRPGSRSRPGLEEPFSPGFGLPGAPGLLLLGLPIGLAAGCFANGGTIRFLTSIVPAILLVAVDFEGVLVSEVADFLEAPTEGLLLITVATR